MFMLSNLCRTVSCAKLLYMFPPWIGVDIFEFLLLSLYVHTDSVCCASICSESSHSLSFTQMMKSVKADCILHLMPVSDLICGVYYFPRFELEFIMLFSKSEQDGAECTVLARYQQLPIWIISTVRNFVMNPDVFCSVFNDVKSRLQFCVALIRVINSCRDECSCELNKW